MQWRVFDLLALSGALAVTFALLRVNGFAAVAACPLIFGSLAGGLAGQSAEAAIAGFFAAIVWTLVAAALGLHLALLAASLNLGLLGRQQAMTVLPIVAYVVVATVSILGGYLGGRISRW